MQVDFLGMNMHFTAIQNHVRHILQVLMQIDDFYGMIRFLPIFKINVI